jgi:hypothetical protein
VLLGGPGRERCRSPVDAITSADQREDPDLLPGPDRISMLRVAAYRAAAVPSTP